MKAIRTVYCYYFPEVRKIIDEVVKDYPHKIFLSSINPGLDNFHFPIIDKFIKFNEKIVPGLKNFPNKYFTEGSRQGIFHLLVKIKTEEPETPLYVLKGEYEGYKEYAIRIGLNIIEVEEDEDFSKLKPGIWFISNPSGRDGNIIENDFINKICEIHRIIYDLAYVGLTREYEFDVTHPNVIAVVGSMSKSFGLYYYRIGFTFTKDPLETLIANKWFKNIFSLVVADKILDKIKPQELYEKYKPMQREIIKKINFEDNLNIKESDVFLLGNTTEQNKLLDEFKRDKFVRLCLTPYFLEEEND